MDNSNSIMYNKNKENTLSITPLTDFAKQWKEKNQSALKYAGDSAKKSIHAGLNEAPSFMADADEGTYFGDVQTASVKRHLAKDSNNEKLYNASMMEVIGHLSKDNKETYLKHALPLQKYIDAKDEFDFKHNNYTTTDNVDKTPDEKVRRLQRELNESGYTDKFGQKLKEDGIYAGKTAYADDSRKADNVSNNANVETYTTTTLSSTDNLTEQNTSQRFGNRWSAPVRTGERPAERESLTDNNQNTEMGSNENTYINDNGIVKWKELPYIAQRLPIETKLFREKKISTVVYNVFDILNQAWYYADTQNERDTISKLVQNIRDNNYSIESCKKVVDKLYGNENIQKQKEYITNILEQSEGSITKGIDPKSAKNNETNIYSGKEYHGPSHKKCIVGQAVDDVKDLLYGKDTISNNGCELIAVYNALTIKGKKINFSDIINKAENTDGVMWLFGYFGSRPGELYKLFDAYDQKYRVTTNESIFNDLLEKNGVYVISVFNGPTITYGIHTVAFTCDGKKNIIVYNRYNDATSPYIYSSVDDKTGLDLFLEENGKSIILYKME